MTLDEAIQHCKESTLEGDCTVDHNQLIEWLQELKILRVKMQLAEEIISDVSDYSCDLSDEDDTCPEALAENGEDPLFEDSDEWCPFCRARLWLGIGQDGSA